MTKEEMQKQLDELGVKYSKQLTKEKLAALLEESLAVPKTAEETEEVEVEASEEETKEEVGVEDVKEEPAKEVVEEKEPVKEEAPRPVALTGSKQLRYVGLKVLDAVQVITVDKSGKETFIREYSREVHGKDYVTLSESFIAKKNR